MARASDPDIEKMSKLCKECITFFQLNPPVGAWCLWKMGECEGCYSYKKITDPLYFLKLVERPA